MKRILAVAVLVLALAGCSNPYGACVKGGADIANGIKAAMTTVDDIHNAGLVSAPEEGRILDYLKFANDADGAFLTCAKTAKDSGSKAGAFSGCASAFSNTLNNPQELALIQVANSKAQAEVTVIINGVIAGVNTILTSLGGA